MAKVEVSYPAINAVEIGNLPWPVTVPIAKQKAISEYLDAILMKVDAMLDEASVLVAPTASSGGLISEYRDALITAAVTGKIDVGGGGA